MVKNIIPVVETNNEPLRMKKERDSNLELYRIIMMFLIVAHHFAVNSGLWSALSESPITGKSIFLYLFSAWGKPAIDGFMLITGYFMCKQSITVKKYLKLVGWILFYNISIYLIFLFTGKETLSLHSIYQAFVPYNNIGRGFVSCFILFYLFLPFLTKLVNVLSKREHQCLIGLCLFMYSILEILPVSEYEMNYVSWFCVIFFIGSYIRFYSLPNADNTRFWATTSIILIIAGLVSVVVGIYSGKFTHYFIGEANRPLAIAIAVSTFMLFKNLQIGVVKFINTVSASTFGVLLIHANSGAMINWLWNDTIKAADSLTSDYCVLYAIGAVLIVYSVCTIIDILRKCIIEKPLFRLIDKIF